MVEATALSQDHVSSTSPEATRSSLQIPPVRLNPAGADASTR